MFYVIGGALQYTIKLIEVINILCYYKTYLIQHIYFTLKDLPTSSWSTSLEILLTTTIWRGKDLNIIIKKKHDKNVPVHNHFQFRVSLLTMQSFCNCFEEFPLLLWRISALSKQSICTYFAKFPHLLCLALVYTLQSLCTQCAELVWMLQLII